MKRVALLALLALAGVGAAALLAASTASAWGIGDMPPGCSTGNTYLDQASNAYFLNVQCSPGPNNPGVTYGSASIPYGTQGAPSGPTDPNFGATLDAFVNAHYTAPATTAAPTTTTQDATTATTTTTAASSTTTTTTDATTTAAAPADTTASAPAPAPAASTPACDVQCQIDAINVRVTALENEQAKLVSILEAWPNIDPGILAQLMSLTG
jgi:hypothetical protein